MDTINLHFLQRSLPMLSTDVSGRTNLLLSADGTDKLILSFEQLMGFPIKPLPEWRNPLIDDDQGDMDMDIFKSHVAVHAGEENSYDARQTGSKKE